MLKTLYLNGKKIPVPIPLLSLGEALTWVEETLLDKNQAITKVTLDQVCLKDVVAAFPTRMEESSRLQIQADSPNGLAAQSIDALRNLLGVMEKHLKHLAVKCWQKLPKETPHELLILQKDYQLAMDLYRHVDGIVPETCDKSRCDKLISQLTKTKVAMDMAIANSDWKGVARLLLNQMEPDILALVDELYKVWKHLVDETQTH